eukprot:6210839-Pleurochrysis_carterae.AAC.1
MGVWPLSGKYRVGKLFKQSENHAAMCLKHALTRHICCSQPIHVRFDSVLIRLRLRLRFGFNLTAFETTFLSANSWPTCALLSPHGSGQRLHRAALLLEPLAATRAPDVDLDV